MSKFEEYKAIRAKIQEEEAKLKEISRKAFTEVANQLFQKYPEMENFSWNQYTPYFNDGDTCEFSVHVDYPEINGEDWSDCHKKTLYNGEANKEYDPKKGEIYKEVQKFLSVFDEDDLYEMFGDHATIIVAQDSIEVEECNHD